MEPEHRRLIDLQYGDAAEVAEAAAGLHTYTWRASHPVALANHLLTAAIEAAVEASKLKWLKTINRKEPFKARRHGEFYAGLHRLRPANQRAIVVVTRQEFASSPLVKPCHQFHFNDISLHYVPGFHDPVPVDWIVQLEYNKAVLRACRITKLYEEREYWREHKMVPACSAVVSICDECTEAELADAADSHMINRVNQVVPVPDGFAVVDIPYRYSTLIMADDEKLDEELPDWRERFEISMRLSMLGRERTKCWVRNAKAAMAARFAAKYPQSEAQRRAARTTTVLRTAKKRLADAEKVLAREQPVYDGWFAGHGDPVLRPYFEAKRTVEMWRGRVLQLQVAAPVPESGDNCAEEDEEVKDNSESEGSSEDSSGESSDTSRRRPRTARGSEPDVRGGKRSRRRRADTPARNAVASARTSTR